MQATVVIFSYVVLSLTVSIFKWANIDTTYRNAGVPQTLVDNIRTGIGPLRVFLTNDPPLLLLFLFFFFFLKYTFGVDFVRQWRLAWMEIPARKYVAETLSRPIGTMLRNLNEKGPLRPHSSPVFLYGMIINASSAG